MGNFRKDGGKDPDHPKNNENIGKVGESRADGGLGRLEEKKQEKLQVKSDTIWGGRGAWGEAMGQNSPHFVRAFAEGARPEAPSSRHLLGGQCGCPSEHDLLRAQVTV